MFVTPGACGWFSGLLFGPNLAPGHFIAGGLDESYGKQGRFSTADFDFNELFAGKGDTLWLNTESNAWTTAVDPSLRNVPGCAEITLKKTNDGGWRHFSYWDSPIDHGFFPTFDLSDPFPGEAASTCAVMPSPETQYVTQSEVKRNFNFCVESHGTFSYVKGQKFQISGDDDIWVFINDKLVIDRGGVHPPASDSVLLDTMGLNQGIRG